MCHGPELHLDQRKRTRLMCEWTNFRNWAVRVPGATKSQECVSINAYETVQSHLPSTENANSTFPGIPPQIAYPEFTKTIPPAIAGPPPSMEPPLASTPLTVI